MPKAKPVSLHPLSFDDAIRALIIDPQRTIKKTRKLKRKRKVKKSLHK